MQNLLSNLVDKDGLKIDFLVQFDLSTSAYLAGAIFVAGALLIILAKLIGL